MIDGRLLLPAASCWLVSVLTTFGLASHRDAAVPVALLCAGAIVVGLVLGQCRRTVAAVVICVGVGGAAAAVHSSSLHVDPLQSWVQARAMSSVDGVMTTEARVRTNRNAPMWQQEKRQEARLSTSRVSARGDAVQVQVPLQIVVPEGLAVPPPGTWVHCTGRLRPVDWTADAAGSLSVASIEVTREPGVIDSAAQALRIGLRRALPRSRPEAASLVAGLAIGDESQQPSQLALDMRNSGLSHLTAVSGGNTASIIAVVVGIATLLGLGLRARVVSGALGLAFFVVVVGPQPSVLRAAVMGLIVLIGMLGGGRRAGPSVLAAAVLILCVVTPGVVDTWAFALSACAAGGIILLVPRIDEFLRAHRVPPGLALALAVTAAAQVATFPVMAAMGGTVGWVALPANLLAMPVVPVITMLGLLAAILGPVLPAAAAVVAWLASWPAGWIVLVAQYCSGLPLARVSMPSGWLGLAASLLLIVVGVVVVRSLRLQSTAVRRMVVVTLALLAVVYFVWPPTRRSWPPPNWLMIACDVGQGDALLLRASPESVVVVDAGPDPAAVSRCLVDARVASVPAVVLTHFHADHVLGLPGVLSAAPVGEVLVSPVPDPPEQVRQVDEWLAAAGLTAVPVTCGDERIVGFVRWRALWPRRVIRQGSVPNNASVVLVASIQGRSFLLSGDVEAEAETAIADALRSYRFDVVKVPHHGSANASPALTTWAPAPIAIISVGRGNPYGHPAASTVADWEEHGAVVARTDLGGDLAVIPSGDSVALVPRRDMLGPP